MMTLTVKGTTYKVRYGYNCFCDSDIFDQVKNMLDIMQGAGVENDDDVASIERVKDLFLLVRELLFLGFKKYNPVDDIAEIGDLLDDYMDEAPEGEDRGLVSLFTMLTEELVNEGFLSGLLSEAAKVPAQKTRSRKK